MNLFFCPEVPTARDGGGLRREYGEGKGEENEIGSWRVLHHPPVCFPEGGSEKWKEKNPSANTFVYPYCCYAIHIPHTAERPEKASKKLFSRHFWHGGRGKEFFLPGFSKIYRTIPLTFFKKGQQRRVGKKKASSGPPTFSFFSVADRHWK